MDGWIWVCNISVLNEMRALSQTHENGENHLQILSSRARLKRPQLPMIKDYLHETKTDKRPQLKKLLYHQV
jgi:hypothetical protein